MKLASNGYQNFFYLYILRSYNDFSEKFQKFVTNFSTIFERVKFFFV